MDAVLGKSALQQLGQWSSHAEVTHDHPEGIKGAQATALAIFRARSGESMESIRAEIQDRFAYDLRRTLDEIRPIYTYDVSCQGTVPEAMIAFLESISFEDALRNAVSLGGDSDTLACITGGIAQAYYGEIPGEIETAVRTRLPEELLQVLDAFEQTYALRSL
jgi:ADP-ribosylglycohydrolase